MWEGSDRRRRVERDRENERQRERERFVHKHTAVPTLIM